MGYSILELVLRRLRAANFLVSVAFPGQKFPRIQETVATAHIKQVDRANMTVTMEVSILAPAAMGGTACEMEALRATEVLRGDGAVCVQNGCTYDGVAQVYVVQVLATFTGVTEENDCTIWPGFYCYVADALRRYATVFASRYQRQARMEYTACQVEPIGCTVANSSWEIELEELIPAGSPEATDPEGEFVLELVTEKKTEQFTGCRWTSIERRFSKQGVHKHCKGVAMNREVT